MDILNIDCQYKSIRVHDALVFYIAINAIKEDKIIFPQTCLTYLKTYSRGLPRKMLSYLRGILYPNQF